MYNYIGELPKALSVTETENLCKRINNNDTSARKELIEANLKLVFYMAKKFQKDDNLEDLISIGTIGLIKAVDSFKLDKGFRFATYASRCISNEILMSMRTTKKWHNSKISLDHIIWQSSKNETVITLEDTLVDKNLTPEELYEKQESLVLLKRACDKLTERERTVFKLFYDFENKMTQKDIAVKLGISQGYVNRILMNARAKIKRELNK